MPEATNHNDQEIIREFLIETSEMLARLDNEILELENRPKDGALLASIFRAMHTVKGTCGFLGFGTLEAITHEAETILSHVRAGHREVTPGLISLVLEVMDATRDLLASIEATGGESDVDQTALIARLKESALTGSDPVRPEEAASALSATSPAAETGVKDAAAGASAGDRAPAAADSTIRVDVELLDRLMNLVGELVLTRNQILQHQSKDGSRENMQATASAQRLDLITGELQESVMKTRMQPIGNLWSKLPRVVRDLSRQLGKQIQLVMDGAETELDKTIIEAIKDPLTHLVRNACDHGVEFPDKRRAAGKAPLGTITLRAFHAGGQVNIEISDDGAGIDQARVKAKAIERGIVTAEQAARLSEREGFNLIFEPGFSTAASVTNVSGRGVGMDVVKSNVERIGGVVDLTSRPGEGSTVRLKIPLTLAIVPGLVVGCGPVRFVIPQVNLVELIRLESGDARRIEEIQGVPFFRLRGQLLPIVELWRLLELSPPLAGGAANIVVLQADGQQFGLLVDKIHDTQEIVVKPLARLLKGLPVYAGATVMGDGRVALILDVAGIGHRAGVERAPEAVQATAAVAGSADGRDRILLFAAGGFERLALPLRLIARLEEIPVASVERASGQAIVQYRGQLLPLINLASLLGGLAEPESETLQVVVFNERGRSYGLVVDRIVDVVESEVRQHQPATRDGLLGSAVVADKVADFVDLAGVLRLAGLGFAERTAAPRRVLLGDESPFARGVLRGGLEMAGYRVTEAASSDDLLRLLEQVQPDAVVLTPEWLAPLRGHAQGSGVPALALVEPGAAGPAPGEPTETKFDWPAMLRSLEALIAPVHSNREDAVSGAALEQIP